MKGSTKLRRHQIKSLVLLGFIAGELTFCGLLLKGVVTGGAQGTVKAIKDKVASGRSILDREQEISDLYSTGYADLENLSDHVPKSTDPYAWAYEYVSVRSQRAQVPLKEVEEVKAKSDEGEDGKPYYQIRVALDCSYEKTIQFLNYLENDNPLLLVAKIEINSNKDDPLAHSTELLLQWPLDFVIETGK